jgi:hypothetical protein
MLQFENTSTILQFENTSTRLQFTLEEYDERYEIYRVLLEYIYMLDGFKEWENI